MHDVRGRRRGGRALAVVVEGLECRRLMTVGITLGELAGAGLDEGEGRNGRSSVRVSVAKRGGRSSAASSAGVTAADATGGPVVGPAPATPPPVLIMPVADLGQTPPPVAKPTEMNTGPTDPTVLVASGSITVNTPGAVIQNVDVTGTITINASNVTLQNFRVSSSGSYDIVVGANATNVVIQDGELTGSHIAGIYGPGYTARRLHIHETGGDGMKPWSNVVIDSCYFHNLGTDPGSHADAIQESGGHNLTITNNNFDVPEYTDQVTGKTYLSNSAIFIHSFFEPVYNVTIKGNWIDGGNFSIYSIDAATGYGNPLGVVVLNNKFGEDDNFGVRNTMGNVVWVGNTSMETGQLV